MHPIVRPSPHDYPMMIPWFLANSPWHPHSNRWLSGESSGAFHQQPHSRGRTWSPEKHLVVTHGSLNVPIEHHPTIRYMVYNGYYKVMSNIPKMGQLPTTVTGYGKPTGPWLFVTSSSVGSFSHPPGTYQSMAQWRVWGLQLFANRSLCPILSNGACRQKGWGELKKLNNVYKPTIQKKATWSNLKQPTEKKNNLKSSQSGIHCCRLL